MKFLVMSFSPYFCYFLFLRYKYLSQHAVVTLSPCSFLQVRDQVSHPHKTMSKFIVLYVLIFWTGDGKTKDCELNVCMQVQNSTACNFIIKCEINLLLISSLNISFSNNTINFELSFVRKK
jgi:hypothetical protein